MEYLLALDQGTSSTRALLYSLDGSLVASHQQKLNTSYPRSGWVEQDAEEIWQSSLAVLKAVSDQAKGGRIIACGITNQRETVLAWDKQTGEVLTPAIVWQDRRTEEHCQSLAEYQSMVQEKTGLRIDPYFSASKIQWLFTHNPSLRTLANADRLAIATIDSFLLWRLTKGKQFKTDVTNASRTLLFNLHQLDWDKDLLNLWQVPESVLPKVSASDALFGQIDKEWLGYEVPVHALLGDQQAALVGQACFQPGMVKATYGTGGFLLMNMGDKPVYSQSGLLTTLAYQLQGQVAYGLEGSIYQAGTTIKWLQEGLGLIQSAAETAELAASLNSNEGVYLVSSFTGLGAPHWSSATGAFIAGLSRQTKPAHLARAALEGVVYQTRDILESIRQDNLAIDLLRVDGGMAANPWFLQCLADQAGRPVQKASALESTALGAALAAGLGLGIYKDLNALSRLWREEKIFKPREDKASVETDYQGWQEVLQRFL